MVNSLSLAMTGVRLIRLTMISTCSPVSTRSPEPISQLADQEQPGEPLPVQFIAVCSSN